MARCVVFISLSFSYDHDQIRDSADVVLIAGGCQTSCCKCPSEQVATKTDSQPYEGALLLWTGLSELVHTVIWTPIFSMQFPMASQLAGVGCLQEEIVPKNILMIGPTGCGKTEIARRLAKLADAPFVKV